MLINESQASAENFSCSPTSRTRSHSRRVCLRVVVASARWITTGTILAVQQCDYHHLRLDVVLEQSIKGGASRTCRAESLVRWTRTTHPTRTPPLPSQPLKHANGHNQPVSVFRLAARSELVWYYPSSGTFCPVPDLEWKASRHCHVYSHYIPMLFSHSMNAERE